MTSSHLASRHDDDSILPSSPSNTTINSFFHRRIDFYISVIICRLYQGWRAICACKIGRDNWSSYAIPDHKELA